MKDESKLTAQELELFNQVITDKGDMILDSSEYNHGDLVITAYADLLGIPVDRQIGRLVQIREEAGAFGSDLFLIRNAEGTLSAWENTHFYRVKDKYTKAIMDIYEKYDNIQSDNSEEGRNMGYRVYEEDKYVKGFLIPSSREDGYVSPTKAIKESIKGAIKELIKK